MTKTFRICGCLVAGPCTCESFECSRGCGATLARGECRWRPGPHGPILVRRQCKSCKAASDAANYAANRDAIRERQNARRADPEVREERLAKRRAKYDPEAASVAQREYRLRPGVKEKRRDEYLRRRYGITQADYNAMLADQDDVCAICRDPDAWPGKGGNFHVDHCHDSGKVRGLLCSACNTALGTFGDDATRLEAAARYLRANVSEASATMDPC